MRLVVSALRVLGAQLLVVLLVGRAFRAAVVFGLANQYDFIYRKARRLRTSPGGSLSDTAIVSEAAYFDLLVTMDEGFARAGQYFNLVIDTCPSIGSVPASRSVSVLVPERARKATVSLKPMWSSSAVRATRGRLGFREGAPSSSGRSGQPGCTLASEGDPG